MDRLHDREYWDLQETANYLAIDKSLVLEHLAREALIKYKGQAISNEYLNTEGDFDDVALIKWIDGFFWLPVDIYVELEDLLLGDLEPLSFQSLMPQFIEVTIKDGKKISFDGDVRCNPASEDWTAIRRFSPYDIVIDKNTVIYFWSNTVEDFAEKNGFNAPLAANMLPTDVVLKKLANDLDMNVKQVAKQNNTQKPIEVNRKDPVREAILNIRVNSPQISKGEMWEKIKKMARDKTPPFIHMEDSQTVFFETGGNAKKDHEELKLSSFKKRYDRLWPLETANNR